MPTETVYDVSMRAVRLATARGDGAAGSAHLTLALLDCPAEDRVQQLLNVCGIKRTEMRIYVEAALESNATRAPNAPRPTPIASRMLGEASRQAHDYDEAENQNALLLIELAAENSPNGEVLRSLGLHPNAMRMELGHLTRAAAAGGNPLKLLDDEAQIALDAADNVRRTAFCGRVSTVHLLLGVLENREVYALQALKSNGVNLDELAQLARAILASDGETAMPETRLTPAAKRALDRARDVAPSRTQKKPITPQALLWGLLPQPVSWRERVTWGEIEDPLDDVWRHFDFATMEQVLGVLLGVESLAAQPPRRKWWEARPIAATKARLDWQWIIPGGVWALFNGIGFQELKPKLWIMIFFAGFGLALLVDLWARFNRRSDVRSKALSFMVGCTIVSAIAVVSILLASK